MCGKDYSGYFYHFPVMSFFFIAVMDKYRICYVVFALLSGQLWEACDDEGEKILQDERVHHFVTFSNCLFWGVMVCVWGFLLMLVFMDLAS